MRTFKDFTVLMMAVLCVGLSSCNKDDNNNLTDNTLDLNLLYGTWVGEYKGYGSGSYEKDIKQVFTFNSNKTWSGTKYEYNIIRENENGTFIYYKDAKAIKLNIENINGFTPTYYILELEGDYLTLDLGDVGACTFKRQK
ncbi:hypothetical protein [Bacteroides neonati]|uniref:hypothetical protein n=1 Tax=Bacteroides neonati TaxID=1347393 RepID=UPI0011DCAA1F|nr:hypothetical protein [Bacteroides neonati]